MILDTSDPIWLDYFTLSELDEIDNEQQSSLAELPNIITEYLNSYKDLVHNAVRTILKILMHGLQKEFKTDADLMKRAWVIIDNCFDYGAIDVISFVFDNRQR
ncbi:hypothetical protein INT45_010246 [Circinella minor]|uniref:Uncharacterized protein n=1 Tax=Circinella minor TaxID=1195481 RepID=A0A8H7VGY2_9FUNG|nr:hypothetical protein INT45_010246 [Circinella minor]